MKKLLFTCAGFLSVVFGAVIFSPADSQSGGGYPTRPKFYSVGVGVNAPSGTGDVRILDDLQVDSDVDVTGDVTAATFNGAPLPGTVTGANPTASLGLSAVNGVANTFLRSDGAPALSQAIAPTWTANHSWTQNSNTAITPVTLDNDSNGTGNTATLGIHSGDVTSSLSVAGSGRNTSIFTNGPTGAQLAIGSTSSAPLVFGTNGTAAASFSATTQTLTLLGNHTISNTAPTLLAQETDAAANNSLWRLIVTGESLFWQTRNDAGSTNNNFLNVNRTGTTIDDITFGNATDLPAITLAGSVAISESATDQAGAGFGAFVAPTFTAAATGFSAAPTITGEDCVVSYDNTTGQEGSRAIIAIYIPAFSGTSNATSFTVTGVPSECQTTKGTVGTFFATNNGAAVTGVWALSAGSGTISFQNGAPGGTWTASGTKGVAQNFIITVTR